MEESFGADDLTIAAMNQEGTKYSKLGSFIWAIFWFIMIVGVLAGTAYLLVRPYLHTRPTLEERALAREFHAGLCAELEAAGQAELNGYLYWRTEARRGAVIVVQGQVESEGRQKIERAFKARNAGGRHQLVFDSRDGNQ